MSHISWDKYFMSLAKVSALRSKDPNTQVGAVIVNDAKRVIALGYNGMPHGNDKDFSWSREGASLAETKYPYVIHAELNAILNATTPIKGATLYVTLFPCSNCSKIIAQSGIDKIVYVEDKYKGTEDDLIAKKILKVSSVKLQQLDDFKVSLD